MRYILACFILIGCLSVRAQKKKVENLPEFNHRLIHFGFILSGNSADFSVFRNAPFRNSIASDTIFGITTTPQKGFGLQGLASLHFNPFFSVRLLPGITFATRGINFTVKEGKDTLTYQKLVESTYVDVPLMFKYKSDRLNKFSAYLGAGGRYTYDLASNQDVPNLSTNPKDILVKLKKNNWCASAVFGTEFYLQYFKFAIELKMSYGLRNVLVKDNTLFSNAIQDLRSKLFVISFTFEG